MARRQWFSVTIPLAALGKLILWEDAQDILFEHLIGGPGLAN